MDGLNPFDGQAEMSFKSYGNVADGKAVVMKLALAKLTSSTAPTTSDLAWYD